jgi:starch synthase (maltosyl-transferring)
VTAPPRTSAPQHPIGRIPVLDVAPCVDHGARPAKSVVGEEFTVTATVLREGHDAVNASLVLTDPDGVEHVQVMECTNPGLNAWSAVVAADRTGWWSYRVEGWSDPYGTWVHDATIKVQADVDTELMLEEGARPLRVERELALYGAWYEFFPRSEGCRYDEKTGTWTTGTLRTAAERLPAIAGMGFDVIYLTPIHPIGTTNRKGPNNTLESGPDDPGSPYAIGSPDGGHDAIEPTLGTFEDFDHFVAQARRNGMEVALDIALQCAPDHPVGERAPRVVHDAGGRHDRVRREPAEEVPGHLPAEFRQRPGRHLRRGAARHPGTGSTTASRSSASTTRTPSRSSSGSGSSPTSPRPTPR